MLYRLWRQREWHLGELQRKSLLDVCLSAEKRSSPNAKLCLERTRCVFSFGEFLLVCCGTLHIKQHCTFECVSQISLDGKLLALQKPKKVYFALNKPKGYICSSFTGDNAQQSPRLAVDLLSGWVQQQLKKTSQASQASLPPRLFTVGRLDVQSTGLILVTNDGAYLGSNCKSVLLYLICI